jgi:acyl-CoA thioesterase-2
MGQGSGVTDDASWRGFVHHLHLDTVEGGVYEGSCLPGRLGRIYGGHVVAHALVAATSESDRGLSPLSLHLHFLQEGDCAVRVRYVVTAIRSGRSFEHWQVVASQGEAVIASAVVVLHCPEPSPSHTTHNPDDSDPDELPVEISFQRLGLRSVVRTGFDIRRGLTWQADEAPAPPYQNMWFRCVDEIPDDPITHAAVLAWASDLELTWTADLPYREGFHGRQATSLDHVIYFHQPIDMTRWWLYRQTSPAYDDARALSLGEIYSRDGDLAASVSQRSLLRFTGIPDDDLGAPPVVPADGAS